MCVCVTVPSGTATDRVVCVCVTVVSGIAADRVVCVCDSAKWYCS